MKKILLILPFIFIVSSCYDEINYDLPEASFDPVTCYASLAGFRMRMSARIAKQVAQERGYKINTKYSDLTFDDIAERGTVDEGLGLTIYIERDSEHGILSSEQVVLDFNYGIIEGITHENLFYPNEMAKEIFESYLKKFPQLTIKNEREGFRSYNYEPNKLAYVYTSIDSSHDNNCHVKITIKDRNYSQSKSNQKLLEDIAAIRSRY